MLEEVRVEPEGHVPYLRLHDADMVVDTVKPRSNGPVIGGIFGPELLNEQGREDCREEGRDP